MSINCLKKQSSSSFLNDEFISGKDFSPEQNHFTTSNGRASLYKAAEQVPSTRDTMTGFPSLATQARIIKKTQRVLKIKSTKKAARKDVEILQQEIEIRQRKASEQNVFKKIRKHLHHRKKRVSSSSKASGSLRMNIAKKRSKRNARRRRTSKITVPLNNKNKSSVSTSKIITEVISENISHEDENEQLLASVVMSPPLLSSSLSVQATNEGEKENVVIMHVVNSVLNSNNEKKMRKPNRQLFQSPLVGGSTFTSVKDIVSCSGKARTPKLQTIDANSPSLMRLHSAATKHSRAKDVERNQAFHKWNQTAVQIENDDENHQLVEKDPFTVFDETNNEDESIHNEVSEEKGQDAEEKETNIILQCEEEEEVLNEKEDKNTSEQNILVEDNQFDLEDHEDNEAERLIHRYESFCESDEGTIDEVRKESWIVYFMALLVSPFVLFRLCTRTVAGE
eukprot:g2028.t1